MRFHLFFTVLCAVIVSLVCQAQQSTQGYVINAESKEPLPFAHIFINGDQKQGTLTDINGYYTKKSTVPVKYIKVAYVGFKSVTFNPDSMPKNNGKPVVYLAPLPYRLDEVVVTPGENPAHRIIRKAVNNKPHNNPEKIESFKYTSYNKVIYDFMPAKDSSKVDSTRISINKFLKGGHVFLMESVTERIFEAPDRSHEKVIGNRVSGFKNPTFASLATDLQPFSFYTNLITILDINYLNPISPGSTKKYIFEIKDTLYFNQDTTFIISFKPRPKKNFDGLKGLLYINTNQYAIQSVTAEPMEKGFIDMVIQQQYKLVKNKQWFPEQLNFEMIIAQYPSDDLGMKIKGESYIREVELYPDLKRKDFKIDAVALSENATKKDSSFWGKERALALNQKEQTTYNVMDSVGKANHFDDIMKMSGSLSTGRIPIGFVDLSMKELLMYNQHEGLRVGMGLYTNSKLLKPISIGGFFGYGFRDYRWKYGGSLNIEFSKDKEFDLDLKYVHTLKEIGINHLDHFTTQPFNTVRTYLTSRMEFIDAYSAELSVRALKYVKIGAQLYNETATPQFAYTNVLSDGFILTNYINTEARLFIRYAHRERFIQSFGERISMGTKYPILTVNYARGLEGIADAYFTFNRIQARIEKKFISRSLGETRIRVEAGYIDEPLPLGLLFTGQGSFSPNLPIIAPNYFQSTTPYEFVTDQYTNVYFSHHFKSLLLKIGNFKPQFSVHQNMAWGSLSNETTHNLFNFNTPLKGFYESGLQIDNVLRMNYLNMAYIGYGVGIFYRYGPYAHPKTLDNFALKLSMTFSSK